jgi:hypothetical protein
MFRELRIKEWFHSLRGDCRFAFRQIRKSPTFAVVAVLTLALGIGSSTAIFSTIDGTLLHPYPYKYAERLATVRVFSADQFRAWRFPARAFVDFKEHNHTFEDMVGLVYREVHVTRASGTEEVSGASVSPGTFESLGIPALFGRALIASDFKPDATPVFVVSYAFGPNSSIATPRSLAIPTFSTTCPPRLSASCHHVSKSVSKTVEATSGFLST